MADGGGETGGSAEDLERWAGEARAQDAVDSRARERWLRQQADEDATMAGLLVDLAERGDTVVVATRDGGRHQGRLSVVGTDFVGMRTASGGLTLVALAALTVVRTEAPHRPGGRDGDAGAETAPSVTLTDVLAHMAGERLRVAVRAGVQRLVGELVTVGADVVTLRTDGEPAAMASVPLASVSEVYLLDSG